MTPAARYRSLLAGVLALLLVACQGTPPAGTALEAPRDTAALADTLDPAVPLDSILAHEDGGPPATAIPVDGLTGHAVIWDRIREGFRLRQWYSHPRVKAEMDAMLRNPAYLARVSERAQRYLYHITNEVESRDLPLELALLPIVESAFDPFAYSPQQASGLWQFIPGTARHYGLKDSWWYDGRRDVIASTDAALDYLTYLNQLMEGDWLLAIGSYNSGEGTVMRARKKAPDGGKAPDTFWKLRLPKETEAYVPRLLALAAIIDQPQRVASLLHPVPNEPYFVTMENTGGQIDLGLAAELARVPVEEIYLLNPGFNRWATDPKGPHRLNVPVDAADTFRSGLESVPPQARVHWERHQVKAGESLGLLARQYRTTVEQIQAANGLKRTVIVAGQYLLIPTSRNSSANYALSSTARQAALADKAMPGRSKVLHTVKAGETYWSIGRQHGASSEQVARWNNRSVKDTLKAGESLVLWPAQSGSVAASASSKPVVAVAASPELTRKVGYRVRQGDSLYRIADRFKVSVQQILQWNRLDSGKHLQPGQQLTIFVNVGSL